MNSDNDTGVSSESVSSEEGSKRFFRPNSGRGGHHNPGAIAMLKVMTSLTGSNPRCAVNARDIFSELEKANDGCKLSLNTVQQYLYAFSRGTGTAKGTILWQNVAWGLYRPL
jgi:hypothetical protein